MTGGRSKAGVMTSVDDPAWEPLFDLLGEDFAAEWLMWMYEVRLSGGARVQAYKHR